jgi:hypothetical protein
MKIEIKVEMDTVQDRQELDDLLKMLAELQKHLEITKQDKNK